MLQRNFSNLHIFLFFNFLISSILNYTEHFFSFCKEQRSQGVLYAFKNADLTNGEHCISAQADLLDKIRVCGDTDPHLTVTHQKESVPKIEELKPSRQNQVPVGYGHLQVCTRTESTTLHSKRLQFSDSTQRAVLLLLLLLLFLPRPFWPGFLAKLKVNW